MAHHTVKSGYSRLVDRINRFPLGAPPSELLNRILLLLFSEREAELVSLLPIRPFNTKKASKIWKLKESETRKILNELASRAILVDIEKNGESWYALPPPMAGFFEFSLMRVNKDLDQKLLSELFYQYLNVEEEFVTELFTRGETQLGRVFVNEKALSDENVLYVLDYERVSEVINSATHIGIGLCYCRHKKQHLGIACDNPLEICMTFNTAAASLIKHGHVRKIDKVECTDLLDQAQELNLVQFGENIQKKINFICNCCGCCCEAMIAARKFTILNPVHTTNFIPVVDKQNCNGCGRCVSVCPVEAISLVSSNNPKKLKEKKAKLDESVCLGCGVCVRVCKHENIKLKSREKRIITPVDGVQKTVLMAIERGKMQNLIFDNQVLWSHRALAAVLGVILALPPVKQMLVKKQLKSRYIDTMTQAN